MTTTTDSQTPAKMDPDERAIRARALRSKGMSLRAIAAALSCSLASVQRALARPIAGVDQGAPMRSGRPKKSITTVSRAGKPRGVEPDRYAEYRARLTENRAQGFSGVVAILCADPDLTDEDRAAISSAGTASVAPGDLKQMCAFFASKLRRWESTAMLTPQQLASHYNSLMLRMEAAVQLTKELSSATPEAINITFDVSSEHVGKAPQRLGLQRSARPQPTAVGDTIDTED